MEGPADEAERAEQRERQEHGARKPPRHPVAVAFTATAGRTVAVAVATGGVSLGGVSLGGLAVGGVSLGVATRCPVRWLARRLRYLITARHAVSLAYRVRRG
ncbi:hypothetical protein GCM10012280_39660 [Wenjunlia tyrosinilytica]|uniref:Uncharacterized protein n=1 Tax=Wenjunlia tyrosinilytica TaxID=1544741 RepID=A0A917ZRS8_9ACTN|nr:hypothetical protein GCM10012280_39660 [Wenjunlia tyrosinilytica]